jgi:hypothetical protein
LPPTLTNYLVDDASPLWSFSANQWHNSDTSDPLFTRYFDETYHSTNISGASAELRFNGTGIWVAGSRRQNYVRIVCSPSPPPVKQTAYYRVRMTLPWMVLFPPWGDTRTRKHSKSQSFLRSASSVGMSISLTSLPCRYTPTPSPDEPGLTWTARSLSAAVAMHRMYRLSTAGASNSDDRDSDSAFKFVLDDGDRNISYLGTWDNSRNDFSNTYYLETMQYVRF